MPSYEKRKKTKDLSTGESNTEVITYTVKSKGFNFVMFNTTDKALALKWKITAAADMRLLDLLCKYATYNKNFIDVSPYMRKELMRESGITHGSQFTRSKNNLIEAGIIRVDKNRFFINPNLYFRGNSGTMTGSQLDWEADKSEASVVTADYIGSFENEAPQQ